MVPMLAAFQQQPSEAPLTWVTATTGGEPCQGGCQHRVCCVTGPCTCRWWALPEVGVVPTLPLLAGFQQLVELDESKRILHELAQHRPVIDANSFSELKVSLLSAVGWVTIGVLVHDLALVC